MSCPPKIERPVRRREFVKPSSLVVRCLFGTSDPQRTKQMLDDLLQAEARRFAVNWNFDLQLLHSAENLSKRVSQNNTYSPKSNLSRFEWKKEDASRVADFYARPVHPHYSEKKNLMNAVAETQENFHKDASVESKTRNFAFPFSPRDANCLTTRVVPMSKRLVSQTFTSPPRLSSERPNQTSLRVVAGVKLQQPLSLTENTPSKSLVVNDNCQPFNHCSEHLADAAKQKTASIKLKEKTTSNNESLSSKTPASRQLFAQKRKSDASTVKEKQPKITDFIPVRRPRIAKRPRQETANQLAVAQSDAK